MANADNSRLIMPIDLPAAIGLLTRLPVRPDPADATARGAAAAWAYPLAGLIVAALAAIIGQIAVWFGLPDAIVAAVILAALVIVTGAMHEDGLADAADGLWGGWTTERRLEIMKDSRTGAYGVIAIVLSLLIRWAALTALLEVGQLWSALLISAAAGRAAMVALMHLLPHARQTGLSHGVGRPSAPTTGIALGIAAIAVIVLSPFALFALALVCGLVGLACLAIARQKIGGQTGDILGATGQMVEIAVLLTLTSLI